MISCGSIKLHPFVTPGRQRPIPAAGHIGPGTAIPVPSPFHPTIDRHLRHAVAVTSGIQTTVARHMDPTITIRATNCRKTD